MMKDYKKRIKNHEFQWRPEAWVSMEELINQAKPNAAVRTPQSWWKHIFGCSFKVMAMILALTSIQGNPIREEANKPKDYAHEQGEELLFGNSEFEIDPEIKTKIFEDPITSEVFISETEEVTESERIKKVTEEKSDRWGNLKASQINHPEFKRMRSSSIATKEDTAQNTAGKNAGPQSSSITMDLEIPDGDVPLQFVASFPATEVFSQTTAIGFENHPITTVPMERKRPERTIQLGVGLSSIEHFSGWMIGGEKIASISPKLDLGGGLAYKFHESPWIGPVFTGFLSRKKHHMLEGDLRLYWKFFHRGRHQIRLGGSLGVQLRTDHFVRISMLPDHTNVFHNKWTNWHFLAQTMADYRFYLSPDYHLGLQLGAQPNRRDAFFLKFSAGISW